MFAEVKKKLEDGKALSQAEVRGAFEEAERAQQAKSAQTALTRSRMNELKEEAVDLVVQTGTFATVEFIDGASEKGIKVMGRDPRLFSGVVLEGIALFGTMKGRAWARHTRSVGRGVMLSGLGAMARGAGQKWRAERKQPGAPANEAAPAAAAAPVKPAARGVPELAPPVEVLMSPPGRRGPPPVPVRRDEPVPARRMPPFPQ